MNETNGAGFWLVVVVGHLVGVGVEQISLTPELATSTSHHVI